MSKSHHIIFGVTTPPKYLYLGRALIFQNYLGIHPSNTGDKFVYYYLYNVEASYPMEIFPHPFNMPFIIFIQT